MKKGNHTVRIHHQVQFDRGGSGLAREKISDSDVVLIVLGGLGQEYNSFIQNVTSKSKPVFYRKLKYMLTDLEER